MLGSWICTEFFQKRWYFSSINPNYDIMIWQKFYIYCFLLVLFRKSKHSWLENTTCQTKNVEFLWNQDVIIWVNWREQKYSIFCTWIFGLIETIFCKSQILHNVDYTTVCLLFYVAIVLGSELDSMENWLMKVWQIENRVSAHKHIKTLFSSSNDVSKKLIIVVLPLTLMSENFAQITALDPSALCSN